MMNMSNEIKGLLKKMIFLAIKPFIVPILIILIILFLSITITDFLYVAFINEEEVDLNQEIKYYDETIEYEREEMKGLFASVWSFIDKVFGTKEIAEETDWPVIRILYNFKWLWTKKSTNSWSFNSS